MSRQQPNGDWEQVGMDYNYRVKCLCMKDVLHLCRKGSRECSIRPVLLCTQAIGTSFPFGQWEGLQDFIQTLTYLN